MRIALILPGFSRNQDDWAIPAIQNLAASLAQSHQVQVFSLRYPAAGRYSLGGLIHHAIGGGQRFRVASLAIWWRALGAVIHQHRLSPFDLFHAFWADEPGLVAGLAGRLLRRPAVVSLGGGELTYLPDIDYGTQGSPFRRQVVRLALRLATVVTAGSHYQLDLVHRHGVPPGRSRLLQLGVDTDTFQPGPTPKGSPTIIQAASLTPVKNQALLLEILALARRKEPDLRLLLAGDGPLRRDLSDQAAQLGLADCIIWAGKVRYPDVPALYQRAHLYVQTSYHESQGMAVAEALACGLPVVGTPVGILPEAAARMPAATAEALAGAIADVLDDRATYEALRIKARETAENRYSLTGTVDSLTTMYRALIART